MAAQKEVALTVPLVVRLEGTNVEKGREILKRSKTLMFRIFLFLIFKEPFKLALI